jgi:hypothetical protein
MKTRAAVISVFRATSEFNEFADGPAVEVVFRQPFHDLGLAFSFQFAKTYVAPFGQCALAIENISSKIAEAFTFDRVNYTFRPKVEIRAGYSDVIIKTKDQISTLKNSLDVVYTGFPFYTYDEKIVGGRVLTVNLSDVSTTFLQGNNSRVVEEYRAGVSITNVLKDLLGQIPGLQYDLSNMVTDVHFVDRTLPHPVFFNNLPILSTVIPNLGREYGFYFTVDGAGKLIFRGAQKIPSTGGATAVNSKNGMVEHPAKVNATHVNVRTLFGLPRLFYPGEWMTVQSDYLDRALIAKSKSVSGAVINAQYAWNDESALVNYILAPEGVPVASQPVITTI